MIQLLLASSCFREIQFEKNFEEVQKEQTQSNLPELVTRLVELKTKYEIRKFTFFLCQIIAFV